MYSSNKTILQLLSLMKLFNIRKVVISPGSRHFPIVHSMESDTFFQLYSVVDERSAAFFALGLIQQSGEPVAICCSSGTASINYGSAVVEAFYQHLPLLVLTTDRLPELLGQLEDQMYQQDEIFRNFIKYEGQLRDIKSSFDEWYCNRIINEALLSLNRHGNGPVHLNIPIESHHSDTFSTEELPKVRKIDLIRADEKEDIWPSFAKTMSEKKILIILGESYLMPDNLKKSIDDFTSKFNCVILTDKLSNCHQKKSIENTFSVLRALSLKEQNDMAPNIVITLFANYIFNNEIKAYLQPYRSSFEHWHISPDGMICDPFRRLSHIFEMQENTFFEKLLTFENQSENVYADKWEEVSQVIEEPKVEYSELYAIGKLIHSIPKNVVLQLANSCSVRMAHLFKIDCSVKVHCNRGVNGIDGCMSTAVGYAANSEEPVFLIIGDLAFFYDMNALWNRNLSSNLRILLINNEGGAVMHMPLSGELARTLPKYVSAGHVTSAKGWVESIGVKYIAATNQTECDEGIKIITDINVTGPILLEVFTKKEEDVRILKQYFQSLSKINLVDKIQRKAVSVLSGFLKKQ